MEKSPLVASTASASAAPPSAGLSRILLLHTGGTFGMTLDEHGAAAAAEVAVGPDAAVGESYLETLKQRIPELEGLARIEVRVLCNLDSSDVGPAQWELIARAIEDAWEAFDGFVVVHGTDTLAFTACALSFFLAGLTKTVVLTGSQRPLAELRTDARANLIDSVELAATGIPEVLVCFDGLVHRGTRATKYSNEHMHAFRSPNASPLGHLGVHFRVRRRLARKPLPPLARTRPLINSAVNTRVTCLDAAPGMAPEAALSDALLSASDGLVLKGFGVGNLPLRAPGWLALCEKARAREIPVVMSTQCLAGRISLEAYPNGRAFGNADVIGGGDMTFEAITLKLMVMLGRRIPFERRHEFFRTPLALELSDEET